MHIPNMIRAWEMERSKFFLASLPLNTPHQGDQSHDHKVKSFVFFQFSLIFLRGLWLLKITFRVIENVYNLDIILYSFKGED